MLDPAGGGAAERVGWLHDPVTLVTAAGLATLAALLTIAGPFVRARDERITRAQSAAGALQIACAMLWLVAVGAFAMFEVRAADPVSLYAGWPSPWLVVTSTAALATALGAVAQAAQLPGALAEARRVQGWSAGRKLRHATTVVVFLVAAFVLAAWGALEPWSS